jgi:hypothetical protein
MKNMNHADLLLFAAMVPQDVMACEHKGKTFINHTVLAHNNRMIEGRSTEGKCKTECIMF